MDLIEQDTLRKYAIIHKDFQFHLHEIVPF